MREFLLVLISPRCELHQVRISPRCELHQVLISPRCELHQVLISPRCELHQVRISPRYELHQVRISPRCEPNPIKNKLPPLPCTHSKAPPSPNYKSISPSRVCNMLKCSRSRIHIH